MDDIEGGAGADTIFGGTRDDTIDGGAGADLIFGGTGDDTLTGGADADIFAFGPGDGNDTITDFDTDEDNINLSMFGADLSYSDLTITATTDGTGTIITVPGDDGENNGITITLDGVTTTDGHREHVRVLECRRRHRHRHHGGRDHHRRHWRRHDDRRRRQRQPSCSQPGDGDDTITDFSTARRQDRPHRVRARRDLSTDLTIAATTDGTGTVITLPGDDGDTITLQGVTSTDVTADSFEFLERGRQHHYGHHGGRDHHRRVPATTR